MPVASPKDNDRKFCGPAAHRPELTQAKQTEKVGIHAKHIKPGWDGEYLLKVLGLNVISLKMAHKP